MNEIEASRAKVAHLLRRATFGIRPGQVEALQAKGVGRWLKEQLSAPNDLEPDLDRRLRRFYFHGRTMAQLVDHVMETAPLPVPGRDDVFAVDQGYEVVLYHQLLAQRILRSVYSRWQLREVLTDFWFNHFNAFMKNPVTIYGMPGYEGEAIRPFALGRFRDLLGAVARHPVLLEFLDNPMSNANASGGLNENYGREMLELYTVGVEARYTQRDVVDSARCFSGWGVRLQYGRSFRDPQGQTRWTDWSFGFQYVPGFHDLGAKQVLGYQAPPGQGIEDGEKLLDYLAAHPATARHLARKLAVRLVDDQPPEPLVGRAARTFLETRGDIARVVETILTSEEFFEASHDRVKLKTPLEFVASALRACPPAAPWIEQLQAPQDEKLVRILAGERFGVDNPFIRLLANSSVPYALKAPFGWIDRSETWASSSSLRDRAGLAQVLASAQDRREGSAEGICRRVFAGEVGSQTRGAIERAMKTAGPQAALVTALVSPEFQHR